MMSQNISEHIQALESMKKYPKTLHYKGSVDLLKRPKVSIVGSRRLSNYTREYTYQLSKALASRGVCVVSGAAMGVDTIAHEGAGAENTIAVVANGLDIRYPAINKSLIESIETKGLVLSQFNDGFRATGWSFVVRNELVVALGDILIVTEADLNSGSMRSVEYALQMGKEIYVLPQRLHESLGTNRLLTEGKAVAITDVEQFASRFGNAVNTDVTKDDFFYFCQNKPTFDEAILKFGDRVYEAELEGIVTIHNGIVRLN
ncbi:MAG: Rossmann fold nucleotide-binding protein Smf possibly involved in DNA uptake [uncultured Sulfurovum sp.]|uniref:Rossmann fold nucleotide-binding protein Smf possibly involved in DNA uptake n=1 Tax=uncultured Sulfurovum sp. TaxID=269237 RepID=A0A6S6SR56_9BACT|nr:MAG: Rossmann fold nucleotide-binding protein Smf possibly involved in DNA uptake [uncultured Sulfurovum sp.]